MSVGLEKKPYEEALETDHVDMHDLREQFQHELLQETLEIDEQITFLLDNIRQLSAQEVQETTQQLIDTYGLLKVFCRFQVFQGVLNDDVYLNILH